MKLHPTVTLAEGVRIPEAAWHLHGNVLTCGVSNHRVVVRGFPVQGDGTLGISINLSPLDEPLPLRFRES